jgi:hypothetical protein
LGRTGERYAQQELKEKLIDTWGYGLS